MHCNYNVIIKKAKKLQIVIVKITNIHLIQFALATKIIFVKIRYNYVNVTIVALAYTCAQRHVSCK